MFAYQLTGPEMGIWMELDRPKPAENEVLIRTHAVGICGTDIEMLHGTMPYFRLGWTSYPVILGHEWSGTIVEVGSAVAHFHIGDRVTGDVTIGCGECVNCMRGLYNICVIKQEVGLCRNKDGAFAQYLTMPARHCYHLPSEVDLDAGALVEPAATVVKAIRKAHFEPGSSVMICGDGPIGLLALQASIAYGAGWTVLSGTSEAKLALGREMGANETVNVSEDNVTEFVMDNTRGIGADYSIEASGNPNAVNDCLSATRQGGSISVVGIYEKPLENLDLGMAVVRDLTLCCSVASPNSFEQTLRLMTAGKLNVKPLVTHTIDLEDAPRAFNLQQRKADERIKIHLKPPVD